MKGLEQLAKLGQGFEKEEFEHVQSRELLRKGSFDDLVRDKDHQQLMPSDESKLFSSI